MGQQHLAKAFSIFEMGSVLGGGLALAMGGQLYEAVQNWNFAELPMLSALDGLAPWRITFVLLAVPGLALAVLVALMREPKRALLELRETPSVTHFMARNKALWIWFFVGNACLVSISYANLTWAPTLFVRHRGRGGMADGARDDGGGTCRCRDRRLALVMLRRCIR